MEETVNSNKADYDYGFMVGQRPNRRGTPEIRPKSPWFWRGYMDSAAWVAWQDQKTTGRFWPRVCLRGNPTIMVAFQMFISKWTSEYNNDKAINRLKNATAKIDPLQAFSGKTAQQIVNALYVELTTEPWMKPGRISPEASKVMDWSAKMRKTPEEMPRFHFDDLSVERILADQETLYYVRDTYIAATDPKLIYEAGYRSAQGPNKHSASPERGALRACPDFCDPIAEAHKGKGIFWRGWADRGFGFSRNNPLGPIWIPMTLGTAIHLWEFFDDPQMYDEGAAPGFANRNLARPLNVLRRLYIEPDFDGSICFATPSHRRDVVKRAQLILDQTRTD